jgi:hypothetical protein
MGLDYSRSIIEEALMVENKGEILLLWFGRED